MLDLGRRGRAGLSGGYSGLPMGGHGAGSVFPGVSGTGLGPEGMRVGTGAGMGAGLQSHRGSLEAPAASGRGGGVLAGPHGGAGGLSADGLERAALAVARDGPASLPSAAARTLARAAAAAQQAQHDHEQ